MTIKTISRLATAILLFAACQSDSYKIAGTAEGFADGDTIHLTTDPVEGKPEVSTVVKDGRFEMTGQVDSMTMCFVYSAKDMAVAQAFFLEPATITVKLSQVPGASRVSGTKVNDALQTLNDSAFAFQKEIELLSESMSHELGATPTEAEQQEVEKVLQASYTRLTQQILKTAQANIDNELGFLLVTDNNGITDEQRLSLINSMPPRMRQRPILKELEAALKSGKVDSGLRPIEH